MGLRPERSKKSQFRQVVDSPRIRVAEPVDRALRSTDSEARVRSPTVREGLFIFHRFAVIGCARPCFDTTNHRLLATPLSSRMTKPGHGATVSQLGPILSRFRRASPRLRITQLWLRPTLPRLCATSFRLPATLLRLCATSSRLPANLPRLRTTLPRLRTNEPRRRTTSLHLPKILLEFRAAW